MAQRILLVEDDAIISFLLTEMLADLGHKVAAVVATEADAVAAALRCRPDLMIVDAKLRAGTGIAAVAAILARGWVPHLFVSGGFVRTVARDSIVLRKPFTEIELESAIARAFGLDATHDHIG